MCSTFNEEKMIAIGNPPFGKRLKLAIDFFNHCTKFCHTIAFIVPVQFRKFGVQRHLDKDFHLIYQNRQEYPSESMVRRRDELPLRRLCFRLEFVESFERKILFCKMS